MAQLDLLPPLIDRGKVEAFANSKQILSVSVSPRDNTVGVYASPSMFGDSTRINGLTAAAEVARDLYIASWDRIPSSERRLFITDTSVIFAAFQNLIAVAKGKDSETIRSPENLRVMSKLVFDYVNFAKECWVHASQAINRPDPLQYPADHYRIIYTCISLFQTLYLPDPDVEQAPVGDELMEWLNVHFIEPSTEEGDHLSSLTSPWEEEGFWEYLTRTALRGLTKATVFFLNLLSTAHPSLHLQSLSRSMIPLLQSQPRLLNFTTEREFTVAHHRWKNQVKALRVELDRVPESGEARSDGWDNWWDRISDVVGILEGRGEVVIRVIQDLGGDWKEVCAAWGIFVDPRLRRQELPDVVDHVVDTLPPDPTDLEDMIHSALLTGEPVKALAFAEKLDVWLSCHLGDVMGVLGLLRDGNGDEESGLSIREYHILKYAEYLHSDPALWRITVDYMCACGDIGKETADQVLLRVPLRLGSRTLSSNQNLAASKSLPVDVDGQGDKAQDEASRIRAGDVVGVLKDVNQCCFEYQREDVRRMVCRIAGKTLMNEKHYGLAISYYASAEDWHGLGRVVDRVLEEYISEGPEKFTRLVAEVAPSLQTLRASANSSSYTLNGVFLHRLVFIVRYAEFHQRRLNDDLVEAAADLVSMFEEDVVPCSWWGVLLSESVELLNYPGGMLFTSTGVSLLLRKMAEVHIRASQGSGEDYLGVLMKMIRAGNGKGVGTERDALNKLQIVRLALAKYFARCGVIGVGGKEAMSTVMKNTAFPKS